MYYFSWQKKASLFWDDSQYSLAIFEDVLNVQTHIWRDIVWFLFVCMIPNLRVCMLWAQASSFCACVPVSSKAYRLSYSGLPKQALRPVYFAETEDFLSVDAFQSSVGVFSYKEFGKFCVLLLQEFRQDKNCDMFWIPVS